MAAFPRCSFDSTVSGILLIQLIRISAQVLYQIFINSYLCIYRRLFQYFSLLQGDNYESSHVSSTY
jgi:hypothetical protein